MYSIKYAWFSIWQLYLSRITFCMVCFMSFLAAAIPKMDTGLWWARWGRTVAHKHAVSALLRLLGFEVQNILVSTDLLFIYFLSFPSFAIASIQLSNFCVTAVCTPTRSVILSLSHKTSPAAAGYSAYMYMYALRTGELLHGSFCTFSVFESIWELHNAEELVKDVAERQECMSILAHVDYIAARR